MNLEESFYCYCNQKLSYSRNDRRIIFTEVPSLGLWLAHHLDFFSLPSAVRPAGCGPGRLVKSLSILNSNLTSHVRAYRTVLYNLLIFINEVANIPSSFGRKSDQNYYFWLLFPKTFGPLKLLIYTR